MNDPLTWTTMWGLTMGVRGKLGVGEQWGKSGTTVIASIVEYLIKKGSIKIKNKIATN